MERERQGAHANAAGEIPLLAFVPKGLYGAPVPPELRAQLSGTEGGAVAEAGGGAPGGVDVCHRIELEEEAVREAALRPESRVFYLESLSNPLLEVADLKAAVAVARPVRERSVTLATCTSTSRSAATARTWRGTAMGDHPP